MNTAETPWIAMALNNAWANSTLYSAIQALPESEFTEPRPGFFPSLSETMNHIRKVDLVYLDALENGGLGRSIFELEQVTNAAELAQLQMQLDMRFATYCNGIKDETLASSATVERKSGPTVENVASILLHLVQHQIHHRGQAHVQLQHAGVKPPQLDKFYLDLDRAPSAAAYWG